MNIVLEVDSLIKECFPDKEIIHPIYDGYNGDLSNTEAITWEISELPRVIIRIVLGKNGKYQNHLVIIKFNIIIDALPKDSHVVPKTLFIGNINSEETFNKDFVKNLLLSAKKDCNPPLLSGNGYF